MRAGDLLRGLRMLYPLVQVRLPRSLRLQGSTSCSPKPFYNEGVLGEAQCIIAESDRPVA